MPNAIIKSFAEKSGKTKEEIEKYWSEAESQAKKDGRKKTDSDFYPYVVGIVKKMAKIKDSNVNEEATITTTSIGGDAAVYKKRMDYGNDKKNDPLPKLKKKKWKKDAVVIVMDKPIKLENKQEINLDKYL